jgi:CxxC-x17-CxxC domain-containing protein
MIMEDIRAGRGVAVADPHGDLAEKIIEYIPEHRINDVVYFNPADTDYPIAFNILEQVEPKYRHLVASGMIGVFQKLWADSWGPRLEYILRNAILATLDYPGSTLLSVTRMLSDKTFRKRVVDCIQDPVVKQFWVKEFAGYQDKFASEAVAPIQNKVGQFLSSSLIRNIVGQVKSTIDIRKIMDEKKILIMNLSKGRIGEDNTQLLGSMMITKIQLAAMSRVDTSERDRADFYLYVDEFQNFATDSFATILSEARKYHLNLIMAHQYIEQLTDKVRSAVFGNVGTMVVYRVGAIDADSLVKEFAPVFTEEDLVNLPKYNMCLKLMIDGIASDPFSARCLPPLPEADKTGNIGRVIGASRRSYASPRAEVEEIIVKWHEEDLTPKKEERSSEASAGREREPSPARSYEAPRRPAAESGFNAECASCGKQVQVAFQPDGVRPIFCKNCLAKGKEDRAREMEDRKRRKADELARLSTTSPKPAPVAKTQAFKPVAKAPVQPTKEIGLGDLLNSAPVDFRGKPLDMAKIKQQEEAVAKLAEEKETNDLAINE